ncbi:MAG TPA: hypothetical protein PLS50_02500, partial [Candidatus Dojkabacteria bacterium]|nr:hypothetical protein [Candidatus Dojkabacteria bacterium]
NNFISCWIPLRHLFNFYQAYDKITRGVRHKIVLTKNTSANEVLLKSTTGTPDRFFRIEYVSMWIPRIKPDLQTLKTIEAKLVSNEMFTVNFTDFTCYRSGNSYAAGSGQHALQLATTQKKIIRCWVAFQTLARCTGNQSTNKRVFDNLLTQTIHVRLNGMLFPLYEYRFETSAVGGTPEWRYYNRAYHALMNAGYKMRDDDDGSMITVEQFKDLYPIFFFDMTAVPEDLFKSARMSELEIRWQNGTGVAPLVGVGYHIYVVYESERSIEIGGTNGNMVIKM